MDSNNLSFLEKAKHNAEEDLKKITDRQLILIKLLDELGYLGLLNNILTLEVKILLSTAIKIGRTPWETETKIRKPHAHVGPIEIPDKHT